MRMARIRKTVVRWSSSLATIQNPARGDITFTWKQLGEAVASASSRYAACGG
jgi:hypothetical protein